MSENLPFVEPLPSESRFPSWERHVNKVLNEPDPKKLLKLIHRTEEALVLRWQELTDDPSHSSEREAMDAACENLRKIKIHKLGWPSQVLEHKS